MRPVEFNTFRHSRKAKQTGAALDVPPVKVAQLSADLRALEKVQASRPLRPPGKK